jgi:hypothetical protein
MKVRGEAERKDREAERKDREAEMKVQGGSDALRRSLGLYRQSGILGIRQILLAR